MGMSKKRRPTGGDKAANGSYHQKGQDAYEVEGVVLETLPNATFKVELENKHQVLGQFMEVRKEFLGQLVEERDEWIAFGESTDNDGCFAESIVIKV